MSNKKPQSKPKKQDEKQKDEKKEVFTKEDFLKALKKVTRPTGKASPSKGKSGT